VGFEEKEVSLLKRVYSLVLGEKKKTLLGRKRERKEDFSEPGRRNSEKHEA